MVSGLDLDEAALDHPTISYDRKNRFAEKELLRKVFERVACQCIRQGLADKELILTDSTHGKAHTSRKSEQVNTSNLTRSFILLISKFIY